MGAPDNAWGLRTEHLLSAAILRLDLPLMAQRFARGQGALDAKTEEGGTYDPYAANAPLTLYATGVRNAFDLLWASNGRLYAPTNGSAAGGSTPGYPNSVFASQRIDQAGIAGSEYGVDGQVSLLPKAFELFSLTLGGVFGILFDVRSQIAKALLEGETDELLADGRSHRPAGLIALKGQRTGRVAYLLGPEPGREYLARVAVPTFERSDGSAREIRR